eukprot:GEMP01022529.1.p1 GENE.GEMP01022529.1~~GEMP01022529.1.p1  ORF type:complete len:513 (+),score=48.91 GEMP01022529.1:186-1724(+)
MLWFSFFLCGIVGAADDSPTSCEKSPDAATCAGDFVWSPTAQHCECLAHSPLVEPRIQTSDSRHLQRRRSRVHFDNCYAGQQPGRSKIMTVLFFMDLGFYQSVGGNEQRANDVVGQVVQYANDIFEEQLDIRVHVGKLFIPYRGHSIPGSRQFNTKWMDDVPHGRDNICDNSGIRHGTGRLNAFNSWAYENFRNEYTLWHLFTSCACLTDKGFPSGGLAFLGSVCGRSRGAITVANYGFNEYTKQTFVHEVGHNLDAAHTFNQYRLNAPQGSGNGVMDYTTTTYRGLVQFHPYHQKFMCLKIRKSISSSCWGKTTGSSTSTPGKQTTGRPSGKTLTTTTAPSSKGNLKDTSKNCKKYANEVSCAKKGSRESIRCQKTCAAWLGRDTGKKITGSGGSSGGTGSSGKGSANCNDLSGVACTTWLSVCKTSSIVRRFCRKTCGVCGDGYVRSTQTQEGKGAGTTLLTVGIFCGVTLVLALLIGVAVFMARKKRETVGIRAPKSTVDPLHKTTRRE